MLARAAPSPGVDEIVVDIGRIDAGRWSSGNVELRLDLAAADRLAVRLTSNDLDLPKPLGAAKGVSLECARAVPTESGLACARAELNVSDGTGASQILPLAIGLDWKSERAQLLVRAEEIAPASLWAFAVRQDWVPALEFDGGALDVELELGSGPRGDRLRLAASLRDVGFTDSNGLNAGENLGARLAIDLSRVDDDWRTTADVVVDAGQMYLDPVFVDAGAHPLSVDAEGVVDAGTGTLGLSRVHLRHDTVIAVDGAIDIASDGAIEALELEAPRSSLAPVYLSYLQPFLIGSVLDALTFDGEASAHLTWRAPEGWRLGVDLAGVDVGDAPGRFALTGVRGRLEWHERDEAGASRIAWDGGRVYRIAFGAGALEGLLTGRKFRLQAPLQVPLLGGALEIDALRVDAIGRPDIGWQFRGRVHPLSLERLTEALQWPTFGGRLAGDIPLMRYADGVVDVDGSLDVEVFDGRVRIDGLTVRDPFGVVPELHADIDMEQLSLDALTSTFSFGNIQGRLQGRIHGLTLKDWKPTAFDARFATPEDDDSRHRISQRAVSNLASLGGAGAVLSSTFLRIFDEFSYRRLGISCRLENGVCEMEGVAPAERGYYIVQGGGFPPHIDVIGFNRRVDWEVLLERLRQIVATEGPVIR